MTVLFLGLGMSPRGPRMRAYLASCPIILGSAIKTSKSIWLASIFLMVASLAMAMTLLLPVG